MSWEATAYVKKLKACPDGAEISRGQKCLLLILADYHNTTRRIAWPSVPTLAEESNASLPQTKRDLEYFEAHCLIEQLRPERQGRGKMCSYVFLELDDQKRLGEKLRARPKGVQDDPLFSASKRGSEGVQKQPERGSEGVHFDPERGSNSQRNKEELHEQRTTPNYEPHACGAMNSAPRNHDGLRVWLGIKDRLKRDLPAKEFDLWVRPALLLHVLSGTQLLVALPPSGKIIQAARARLPSLRKMAAESGYGVSLTRYPDDYERGVIRERHPEFYEQMYGNRTA